MAADTRGQFHEWSKEQYVVRNSRCPLKLLPNNAPTLTRELSALSTSQTSRNEKVPGLSSYGSLVFTGGFGNPRAPFSYKSGGSPQSSRRRVCTSVNGDNMACVCPLTSTTLTPIVFITPSSNSALGRAVWRPG